MIAFGDEGSSVISGSVRLAPGLGLTNAVVIEANAVTSFATIGPAM